MRVFNVLRACCCLALGLASAGGVKAAGPAKKVDPQGRPAAIVSLTPEEARRLTAEAGLVLSLPRLRALSPEAAHELATHREESTTVNTTVMVPVSEEKTTTYMVMVPITETKVTAEGREYEVTKSRPEERTGTVMVWTMVRKQVTCTCPHSLQLDGLASVDRRTLAELARHRGNLLLNGLSSLTREEATTLGGHQDGGLTLDGVTSLDTATAERLAAHDGDLSLNGLASLSLDSATALSGHAGCLSLDGVKVMSDDVAEVLVTHQGPVSLKGLTTVSDKATRILADSGFALPPDLPLERQQGEE